MLLYCSSIDHYGSGVAGYYDNGNSDMGWNFTYANTGTRIIGDGWTAQPTLQTASIVEPIGSFGIGLPSWGARRGEFALYRAGANVTRHNYSGNNAYTATGQESMRLAIPGASQHERIIHFAFSVDQLPTIANNHGYLCSFQDYNGDIRGYIGINPSGRIIIYDGTDFRTGGSSNTVESTPAALAVSSSPIVSAETWYSISLKITTNAVDTNADVEVYVGDIVPANLVIDATAIAFTDTGLEEIDILGWLPISFAGHDDTDDDEDNTTTYIRDIVVCDNTGSYNNDHLGQVFVAAQEVRAEDAGGGWVAHPREKIGTGICDHKDASTGMRVDDNALLEIGAGDFTMEGAFRFDEVPSTEEMILIGKWDETNNTRSYKLTYVATDDTLRWEISTDGTAVTTVISYPWVPDLQQWYQIAVSREVVSGVGTTRLFVDGVQLGVDITDSNTYYDGAARLGIASRWDGTTLDADQVFIGWLDEVRFTKGVARYTTDYTPATDTFGRNGVDDSDWSSVELMLGFDGSIVDESDNAFTVTAGTGVQAETPDDGDNSYEVLNQRASWDDTYIEATNTFATTILTLTANPSAAETITLGSKTYTFRTSFSSNAVNEVDIGADTEETLSNLIAAVNAGAGAGTAYGTGTTANADVFASTLPDPQALFTAVTIGTAGNSVASTETMTNGSFPAATLEGGEDIPAASNFSMERLPVDVTGVLGLQVTARGYKSDAGSAQLRFDLVGPAAAVDTGTAQSTDLNPAWMRQVFEEDPDTAATITPSTITGGRVRVTRTT